MGLDRTPIDLVIRQPLTMNVHDFELLRVLGEGSFGRVKLVKNLKTKRYMAFKQLKKYEVIKLK